MRKKIKPIPRFYPDYYFASEFGEIYSIKSGLPLLMKPYYTGRGYHSVNIHRKGHLVHRLVMEAFFGESDLHVNHLNGDKINNWIENLEYCTPKQNMQHAARTGLLKRACIPLETLLLIRRHLEATDLTIYDIAEIFQLNPNVIRLIKEGKNVKTLEKEKEYYFMW